MDLGPVEQLMHGTVRIECDLEGGGTSVGTGFFYRLDEHKNEYVPVIVTNKHVVNRAVTGRFVLTLVSESNGPDIGRSVTVQLDHFRQRWCDHPDPEIDLCVMPVGPLITYLKEAGTPYFACHLFRSLVPTPDEAAEMAGLENVIMIGYPTGLWDNVNNLPIFRKGIVATDYRRDWQGKKQFLIDAAVFPGSSGSPVILFEVGSYATRKTIVAGSRIKFLGILAAGPMHTTDDEITFDGLTEVTPISPASIPTNLGIVIKAEQLFAFDGMTWTVVQPDGTIRTLTQDNLAQQ